MLSRPLPRHRAVRPIPEVNRATYHALGRLAADVQAIARVVAERHRAAGDRGQLEALELVTRLVRSGRKADAAAFYRKAKAIDPGNPRVMELENVCSKKT